MFGLLYSGSPIRMRQRNGRAVEEVDHRGRPIEASALVLHCNAIHPYVGCP